MTVIFTLIGIALVGLIFVIAFCTMASIEDSKAEKLFKEYEKNNQKHKE